MNKVHKMQDAVDWFDTLQPTTQEEIQAECPPAWEKEFFVWLMDAYNDSICNWLISKEAAKVVKVDFNKASLPEDTLVINEGDKDALKQAIENVVKEKFPDGVIPQVKVARSRPPKFVPFPKVKYTGDTPKGCHNEVMEFITVKGNMAYITMAEVVWGTPKSRFKKATTLHNQIMAYVINYPHDMLVKSQNFDDIREATAEEIETIKNSIHA